MDHTAAERFTEDRGKILPNPPLSKEGATGVPLFRREACLPDRQGLEEIFGRLRYLIFRVTVTGESMWPTLTPGNRYWASSLLPYRVGSIVVAKTKHRLVVKRIGEIGEKSVSLVSDAVNGSSYEVPTRAILGSLLPR